MKTEVPDFGRMTLYSWPRAIVHVDGDAFFASCEQALHPEYKGKPVVTGKERGIVAAASYEAKAKGVARGVALWEVKKICPDAIIVPSDYESYSIFSKRMFAIMRRFTPTVEESSIDEGFADITGFRRLYHASYPEIGQKMKDAIESELGITVSLGLSVSNVLAKLGSKHKKPSGFTIISTQDIQSFLAKTPLAEVWGIGPRTAAYCIALGMQTALDFANKSEEYIWANFTKPHHEIWQELNGHKVYELTTEDKTTYASIGKTRTFTPPSADRAFVFAQLLKNLENACIKARRHGLVAKGLTVYLKTQQFQHHGLEARLSRASAFPADMVKIMRMLFGQLWSTGLRPGQDRTNFLYRATGVILTGLQPETGVQLNLFEPPIKVEDRKSVV